MNVENAPAWNIQHFRPEDLSVGYGDYHLGCEGSELRQHVRITQRRGLEDGKAELLSSDFDHRSPGVAAPPGGAIRLRNNGTDAVTAGGEPSQAGDGERGGTDEYDAHVERLFTRMGSRAILAWRRSNAKRLESVI